MSEVQHKDISQLSQKSSVAGTEKIVVSEDNYITPNQIKTFAGVPEISTNLATDKASNTKAAGAKATYDEIHPQKATTQPAGGFLPNVPYELGTISATTSFSLASATDTDIDNWWFWAFAIGSTVPTISMPTGLTWADGDEPTIAANKYYEIYVRNGKATYLEF